MQHVLAKAMAGDFDPSEYDAAMASAFGEDYYNVRPLFVRLGLCCSVFT